jgi:hypothetical protein
VRFEVPFKVGADLTRASRTVLYCIRYRHAVFEVSVVYRNNRLLNLSARSTFVVETVGGIDDVRWRY